MVGFFIALLSGVLMSIQGVFNTQVTKSTGLWVANTFVQFSAFVVCMLVWAIADRNTFSTILKVEPRYLLLGGVLGVGITYTVVQSMALLGPAGSVILIVTAQIIMAYLIEVFGWFGTPRQTLEIRRILGLVLIIIGIIIFRKK